MHFLYNHKSTLTDYNKLNTMKKPMKLTYVFALALVLSIFSCNNDDEETVIPEVIVEINVQNLTVAIDENPTDGQVVGTVQTDSDEASNFSITSQTPTGALSINSNTGEVSVANAALFDFETNSTITATVTVGDAVNPATVTVNLNNLDEISAQDLTVAIDENPTDGQAVGAIQVDGSGTLSFSIASQTPAGALNIDAGIGELTVVDPNLFDFETNPVITANIEIYNGVYTVAAIATINLNDVDEITVQDLNTSIDENPTDGQVIGTIQATSANTLTYAITYQSTAGALSINQNTGELSVADYTLFDYETTPSMFATISVDNSVYSVSTTATIDLEDSPEIGEFKFGGIIFWINPASNNSSGLVCAVSDQSNSIGASWGSNTPTIGNVATAIGTGQANTDAILAVHTQGTNAAKLCNSYTANGFSDWYLPSKDELNEAFINKAIIEGTSAANGGANFKNSAYWTSSEHDTDPTRALLQFFNYGAQQSNQKGAIMHVRAIRTFTDL